MKNRAIRVARRHAAVTFVAVAGSLASACSATVEQQPVSVAVRQQDTIATMNDPRARLAAGAKNTAQVAAQNMRLVSYSPKPPAFDSARGLTYINSDLAFRGNIVYQGNFSGFSVWDVSNPTTPQLLSTVVCATDQGDPSIVGNLLFISAESTRSRNDCGTQGITGARPEERMRGVRIFDVSNPRQPRLVKNIQTCRGSHTHTVVPHPTDSNVIYIYVGGSSSVRDSTEMAGCSGGNFATNPNSANQRIDIIRVPLNNPQQAAVVGFARIFENLPRSPGRAGVADTSTAARARSRPSRWASAHPPSRRCRRTRSRGRAGPPARCACASRGRSARCRRSAGCGCR